MAVDSQQRSVIVKLNGLLELLVARLFPIKSILVFFTTALTVALSMLLAFYLRFEFQFPVKEVLSLERILPVAVIIKLLIFSIFRIYGGMWRYVSIHDMIRIFLANLVASLLIFAAVMTWQTSYFAGLSRSVLVLDFMICFSAISGKRILARIIREAAARNRDSGNNIRTLLLGSSQAANSLIHSFSLGGGRQLLGVLSDQIKAGQSIRGIPILGGIAETAKFAEKMNVSEILLLPPYSSPSTIREIMQQLESEEYTCTLRIVPDYQSVADGKINVSHIRNVEIEDLLGRQPVKLDRTDVAEFISGKTILVTGAGGSIGAELCRQIAAYGPAELVLFELSEYNLYEINRRLRKQYPELSIHCIIGDIRNAEDINRACSKHHVEVIYHAAAYKHVPLMEENPARALETNVLGTSTVLDAAEACGIKRVVIISTDKAVCPSSIMGASKRLAERIALERPAKATEFIIVRFGNVLDSSGSVIPLFKQQIREGGPITVTSANVERFFMSIPEAVDLVLQAAVIGNDRDIMVLEMGKPVRIYDMARNLIELSGLVPDKDIEIKIIGMRPGEKEYEELLTSEEKVERTPFDRICVARKNQSENKSQPVNIKQIRAVSREGDNVKIREEIRQLIPENKFDIAENLPRTPSSP